LSTERIESQEKRRLPTAADASILKVRPSPASCARRRRDVRCEKQRFQHYLGEDAVFGKRRFASTGERNLLAMA